MKSRNLSDIVITGSGYTTPLGCDARSIMKALKAGKSAIRPVVLDGILPVLMARVDVSDRNDNEDQTMFFANEAADDCVGLAGLTGSLPERVSLFVGSSKGRLANILRRVNNRPEPAFMDFPGDTIGLEIARRYGFEGAVMNYSAACATGLVCMMQGAAFLQSGECDVVLAGSVESSGKALVMAGFSNMGALAPSPMRPFHRLRNGFNPGEGGAIFALERENDARARGAMPVARLAGWDQRADAYHITGADPTGMTVSLAIERTLERAGWNPGDVDYINAHGTGTILNDRVEALAIRRVFGNDSPPVSSLKAHLGHLLGASSAVELAVAICCARDGFLPPTLGLDDPDPDLRLNFVPPDGSCQAIRRLLKISLGFGGHIAVMAVEIL